MNQVNRYSFRNVRKDSVLPAVLRTTNLETKEDEADEEVVEDSIVYTLNDDKVAEIYCFKNGEATLYCDNGNQTFAKVFDSMKDGNNYLYAIYRSHGIYMLETINRHVMSAFYMTAEDFEKFDSMQRKLGSTYSPIKNFKLDYFLNTHAVPLVVEGKTVEEFAASYQTLKGIFMRYYMASEYIPACTVIENISSIVNHYIATGKLDKSALMANWTRLRNFQQLCSSSYGIIGEFVSDPQHTDLRKLSESLQKNAKNISNLLDIYLQEELER